MKRFGKILLHRLAAGRDQPPLGFAMIPLEIIDAELDVIEARETPFMAMFDDRRMHLVDHLRRPTMPPKRFDRLAAISQAATQGAVTTMPPEISRASCNAVS